MKEECKGKPSPVKVQAESSKLVSTDKPDIRPLFSAPQPKYSLPKANGRSGYGKNKKNNTKDRIAKMPERDNPENLMKPHKIERNVGPGF